MEVKGKNVVELLPFRPNFSRPNGFRPKGVVTTDCNSQTHKFSVTAFIFCFKRFENKDLIVPLIFMAFE
jgi:hypothetical protein